MALSQGEKMMSTIARQPFCERPPFIHFFPPFVWEEERCTHLRYILDPADLKGPEYPSGAHRILEKKEIRHHDEYCTRRLVLAAWDPMEANGEFVAMGM